MQSILNQGKNYLTIDRRLLKDYQENDNLVIKLQHDNCEARTFSVNTEVECERVLLSFSISQCLDKRGRYVATIQNIDREELHKIFVQLHIKE